MNLNEAMNIVYSVGREMLLPSVQYVNFTHWYEGKIKMGYVDIHTYEKAINVIHRELEKNERHH